MVGVYFTVRGRVFKCVQSQLSTWDAVEKLAIDVAALGPRPFPSVKDRKVSVYFQDLHASARGKSVCEFYACESDDSWVSCSLEEFGRVVRILEETWDASPEKHEEKFYARFFH